MDIVELWADDLGIRPGEGLGCPVCHGRKFTVERTDYGWELACWEHPVYIGIKVAP